MTLHIDEPRPRDAVEIDGALLTTNRYICKVDDGSVFAYVERGSEFFRASDHQLWATEREDLLVSARSGTALAQRRGKVYFDLETDTPIYYERAV